MATMRVLLCGLLSLAACGKDKADFQDLDGEIGVVPGEFNLRLAQAYRDQVDALQARIAAVAPGLSTELTERFQGTGDATDDKGTKLSDLLKAKLPGTDSELLNQRLFGELTRLSGESGAFFDLVDTEKYLGSSTYEPPISTDSAFDPEFPKQYYLEMINWRAGMESVTEAQTAAAAPVVVAVLDTGVLAKHQDLANVMWQNSSADVGYDATTGKALSKDDADDGNGHGTHVAGIIGGEGRNSLGIHGVGFLPGAGGEASRSVTEIMSVKVLNDKGAGTSDMIARGLKWAVDQHRTQKAQGGARANQRLIINMSLGGPFEAGDYDFKKDSAGAYIFEDDLINWATSKDDVLVVVAAGNESCGIGGKCDLYGMTFKETFYYPCSYKNVLCVAASTHEDKLAGFSNRKGSVGLAAPGYQIISTLPDLSGGSAKDQYGYYSGTSQATPVTAGAAAVVWSLYADTFSAADIKLILQKAAAQVAAVANEVSSKDGRLDLKAALAYAAELKEKGKKPADMDPSTSIIATSGTTPSTLPPQGPIDPDAASNAMVGDAGPNDLGEGSANGCAVVRGAPVAVPSSWWVFGLVLLLPLLAASCVREPARRRVA